MLRAFCPLGLRPYVSDYALGGAILGSSLKEGGGRIKQVSSAQITHDMVLRPGPLFMASHVSEGWLPWGTPRLLPSSQAFTSHPGPGTHTAEYAQRPTRMDSDHHGRGGMRTWLRSLLKSNRFREIFSAATPFPKWRAGAREVSVGKCRQRGSLHQGQRRAHTASFISPSHVVKDVKSGERVRKGVCEGI